MNYEIYHLLLFNKNFAITSDLTDAMQCYKNDRYLCQPKIWPFNYFIHTYDNMTHITPSRYGDDVIYLWTLNGKLHRINGPAIDRPCTEHPCEHWYRYGKLHRDNNQPARRTKYYVQWWVNGYLHNLEGPANINMDRYMIEWSCIGCIFEVKEYSVDNMQADKKLLNKMNKYYKSRKHLLSQ